ncbi:MAG: ATP-binding cassette domain-containing protein [Bacteroidetes bacterium]|nr:ATP-binding cassette domain-containing protein [Bacteroidota bacterium]
MAGKDPIIQVRQIGKRFHLGAQSGGYLSLRDQLQNLFSSQKTRKQAFWALKDINFDVYENDRVAIMGRNGAGKSTLLKIISRITPPTKGEIRIHGRIASLLEVGTGFHGELSGRENVYLNGSILGLRKEEIKRRFDEIVAFADVADFIDTPLRHYSSGMQLRLAFAVAAHLEPEILIIDEVLAVGDASFQQKCIGKMKDISDSGRTLLFVSHNMAAIRSLCNRAILLKDGLVELDTDVETVINSYLESNKFSGKEISLQDIPRNISILEKELVFDRIRFEDSPIPQGKDIEGAIWLKNIAGRETYPYLTLAMNIDTPEGICVYHASTEFTGREFSHSADDTVYRFRIANNLRPGNYHMTLFLKSSAKYQDWLRKEILLEIADGNPYGYADSGAIQGLTLPGFDIWTETAEAS